MIYIFKGCAEICRLPCKACDACCTFIGNSCSCIDDFFKPIVAGPLAAYVLGTWFYMALLAAAGAFGVADSQCTEAQVACAVFIGLSVVHAAFAYYLQRQIVSGLARKGLHPSSHQDLAREAVHILLYDVGVCLYILAFLGSFAFACYSFGLLGCGGVSWGFGAATLLVMYAWLAAAYLSAWYCCAYCAGVFQSSRRPPQRQQRQQKPPQQNFVVMGVPMPPQGP
mmetsp:Transcript_31907/g.91974  ORF Transcript_31907/g.91974 Transcript_31907/m.91974 type:complete len:225 (-) Transcript_31907:138-812(-)